MTENCQMMVKTRNALAEAIFIFCDTGITHHSNRLIQLYQFQDVLMYVMLLKRFSFNAFHSYYEPYKNENLNTYISILICTKLCANGKSLGTYSHM